VAYDDTDPLEQDMKVRCEDMNPEQLVTYIKSYQEAFDRILVVDGLRERSVFRGMQKAYGPKTAGQIVKWVFWKYKGIWGGEVITHFDFQKGRKWWVDKMYLELQEHQRRQRPSSVSKSPVADRYANSDVLL
jgi:hypothetical protein